MSALKIFLLGTPAIEYKGRSVRLGRRKGTALLAYLVLAERSVARDTVAVLLWPEYEPGRARADLRNTLYALNRDLPGNWLALGRETVGLNPQADVWIDVIEFRARLDACLQHGHLADEVCTACLDPLETAVALYHGDFLLGFGLRDSPEFDNWQLGQAEKLRQELATALKKLAYGYSALQSFEQALGYARQWLELDLYNEEAHRCLMMLYTWSGQREAALRQYRTCVELLKTELAVTPLPESVTLYELIQQSTMPPLPTIYYPEQMISATQKVTTTTLTPIRLHNLPPQPTPFLGRRADLEQLGNMLDDPGCRLLTLIGLGGSGKTRLALQVAAQEIGRFAHGVCFVSLTQVSDPTSIVPAIAEALNFRFRTTQDWETQLLDFLLGRQLLLVLDNFEHLLMGASLLVRILEQAPDIKLLVTSRERLNVAGEWVFEVGGMALPPENSHGSHNGNNAEDYEAVRLFVETGRRVWHGFSLTADNMTCVVKTCRLVEGLPLAIELAASWLRVLSCEEIAHEIERNLDLLATTVRGVPSRHRSLRATFEHTWQMLNEDEQLAFCKISVFRGGFRREMAEQIAGADLPILASLVDKCLLRRTANGRFEMHELLRQYASEKLAQLPPLHGEVCQRHTQYFAEFVGGREVALKGSHQLEALKDIRDDIDNIRAAWTWAVDHHDFGAVEGMLAGLYSFYFIHSWFRESHDALAKWVRVLEGEVAETSYKMLLAKSLAYLAGASTSLGEYETARDRAQQSLALWHTLEVKPEMALAIRVLGNVAAHYGDFDEASRHFQSSLRFYETSGDRPGLAYTLHAIGIMAENRGDYRQAQNQFTRSLEIFEELGSVAGVSQNLNMLGEVYFRLGEYEAARRSAEKALQLAQETQDSFNLCNALNTLGNIEAVGLGNHREAKRLYEQVLAETRITGTPKTLARMLNNVGMVAQMLGEYDEARAFLRRSIAIFRKIGYQTDAGAPLINLGLVEDAVQNHTEAQQYYIEALASYEKINQPWGISYSLVNLGYSMCQTNNHNRAEQVFHEALEIAMKAGLSQVALNSLVGIAIVLAGKGDRKRALEYLKVALNTPAVDEEIRTRAMPVYKELTAALDAQTVLEIEHKANNRTFNAVVAEILKVKSNTNYS